MANLPTASGEHPSKALWASHNKMVMEPLDANDPEVKGFLAGLMTLSGRVVLILAEGTEQALPVPFQRLLG